MTHTSVIAASVLCLAAAPSFAATPVGQFSGKLWIVPLAVAANAAAPPTATPDVTFTTAHLSFWVSAPIPSGSTDPEINNTVQGFLDSADKVADVVYSGLANPAVGGTVGPSTITTNSSASSDGTFGACMQFTGRLKLYQGELITITHDDGVALSIDGTAVSGLTATTGGPIVETIAFSAKTGVHNLVLNYCNYIGPGMLNVSAKM